MTSLGDCVSNDNNKCIAVPTSSIDKLVSNIYALEDNKNETSNISFIENLECNFNEFDRKWTPKEKEELESSINANEEKGIKLKKQKRFFFVSSKTYPGQNMPCSYNNDQTRDKSNFLCKRRI